MKGKPRNIGKFCREARMYKILQIIQYLFCVRATVKEIQDHFDINQRTVYRYLTLIEESGMILDKDFNGKFFIPSDQCPCCSKQMKHTNL